MKPCPSCGAEIHEEARGCRYCGHSLVPTVVSRDLVSEGRSRNIGLAVFFGVLAVVLIGVAVLGFLIFRVALKQAEKERLPPIASYAEFEQIQVGQSYAEVVEIVGAQGQPFEWSHDPADSTEQLFRWVNPDRSTLSVWFENGKVSHRQWDKRR